MHLKSVVDSLTGYCDMRYIALLQCDLQGLLTYIHAYTRIRANHCIDRLYTYRHLHNINSAKNYFGSIEIRIQTYIHTHIHLHLTLSSEYRREKPPKPNINRSNDDNMLLHNLNRHTCIAFRCKLKHLHTPLLRHSRQHAYRPAIRIRPRVHTHCIRTQSPKIRVVFTYSYSRIQHFFGNFSLSGPIHRHTNRMHNAFLSHASRTVVPSWSCS